MHAIILPGNSKRYNKQGLIDTTKHLEDLFETTTAHYYKHWEGDSEDETSPIDMEHEVNTLAEEVANKDEFVIVAKSVGTVVTLKTISERGIKPKKCVFLGFPGVEYAKSQGNFDKWIKDYNVPTLFIQQTNDPFYKFAELEIALDTLQLKDFNLIETAGDNHAYDNYEEIEDMVKDFITT